MASLLSPKNNRFKKKYVDFMNSLNQTPCTINLNQQSQTGDSNQSIKAERDILNILSTFQNSSKEKI